MSQKSTQSFEEVEVVKCCSVKWERAPVQSWGVRSSLKPKRDSAGVAGGWTGEVVASLRDAVLKSSYT